MASGGDGCDGGSPAERAGVALILDVPLPPEIAFLLTFGIDRAELIEAVGRAQASGVTADRALLAAGLLSAEHFYRLLADFLGVAFLDHPLPVAEGVAIDGEKAVEVL